MTEIAIFKTECNPKLVTIIEMKSQHFAFPEFAVAKSCFCKFCQTQVAPCESALRKNYFGKVGLRKVAVDETAIFIFSFFKNGFLKVNLGEGFIFSVDLFHFTNF